MSFELARGQECSDPSVEWCCWLLASTVCTPMNNASQWDSNLIVICELLLQVTSAGICHCTFHDQLCFCLAFSEFLLLSLLSVSRSGRMMMVNPSKQSVYLSCITTIKKHSKLSFLRHLCFDSLKYVWGCTLLRHCHFELFQRISDRGQSVISLEWMYVVWSNLYFETCLKAGGYLNRLEENAFCKLLLTNHIASGINHKQLTHFHV